MSNVEANIVVDPSNINIQVDSTQSTVVVQDPVRLTVAPSESISATLNVESNDLSVNVEPVVADINVSPTELNVFTTGAFGDPGGNAGELQFNKFPGFGGVPNVFWDGNNLNLGNTSNVKLYGGDNGFVLQTDGTGNLTWTAQTGGGGGGNGTPSGANMQIQYNDSGLFGGNAGFTFNEVTGNVNIPGIINGDGFGISNIPGPNIFGNLGVNHIDCDSLRVDESNIILGSNAGANYSANRAVFIGANAGMDLSGGETTVAIGSAAGRNATSNNSVFIGTDAGSGNVTGALGNNIVGVGPFAAINADDEEVVGVGLSAASSAKRGVVGIGSFAKGGAGEFSVGVGKLAGNTNSGNRSVAVGYRAGANTQGSHAVAVGHDAGFGFQGNYAVALGSGAGGGTDATNGQGIESVAIGVNTPGINQGNYSVAIGPRAVGGTQADSTIVLKAGNVANFISTNNSNAFYVKPIRANQTGNALFYDNDSGEITFGALVANSALTANTVTDNAQPNITSVGTLTSLDVSGNLSANNISGTLSTASQPNITEVGTLSNLTVSGTITGDGNGLSNIAGANVTGFVPNANVANSALSVDGSNVTGTVANAQFATSAQSANTANTVTNNAQPNITSVGTLTSLDVTGNVDADNISANSDISATTLGGTLTTASQPNITNLGNLTSLTVNGNATVSGSFSAGGTDIQLGADANAGTRSVAIGDHSQFTPAQSGQGDRAIAVGYSSGRTDQGNDSIAIGSRAGEENQGQRSIAIGPFAGRQNQANNSIVLNALGGTLDANTANALFVKPIRDVTGEAGFTVQLYYNPTTGEIGFK